MGRVRVTYAASWGRNLENQTVRVPKIERSERTSIKGPEHADPVLFQPCFPVNKRILTSRRERKVVSYASAHLPKANRLSPVEKGDQGPWASLLVAKIEMVSGGVIEVHRLLDEP